MGTNRRRLVAALFGTWVLLTQPGLVVADAFSAQTYEAWYDPIGAEPVTDYCARSGIVDVARNYGQILAYTNGGGAHDCAGAVNSMPTGWIGVSVEGYRNGVFCSQSGVFTNSSPQSNWQLWATQCSNPAGVQSFQTVSLIFPYDGANYHTHVGPTSPIGNY